MKDRLERQVKTILNSLDVSSKKPDKNFNFASSMPINGFNDLLRNSNKYVNSGILSEGLFCVIIMNNTRKLSLKIMRNEKNPEEFLKELKGLEREVLKIIDTESKDNSIHLGSILYSSKLEPLCHFGTTPLFWLPIDLDCLKKIYFLDFVVVTMFNPSHLIKKMKSSGFNIEQSEGGKKWRFVKTIDNKKMTVENVEYFFCLIKNHLFGEEAVFNMIKLAIEEGLANGNSKNAKVELKIIQRV